VLLEGEQGSEKEVVARAIHVGSPREEKPFVKVTCAAFRGDALERELFGWQRGAFDGAFTDRAGRFELAHRGTLYLDDLTSPSPSLQGRLLRVLESGEIERIGATEPTSVDVRVVCSLTPSLEIAWAEGDVLSDLVSRLSVFPVRLPRLRERRGDIRALAEHFLRKYARRNPRAATALSAEAVTKLEAYAWPGNVRELENVIERAAILSRSDVIQPEHLAFVARPAVSASQPAPSSSSRPSSAEAIPGAEAGPTRASSPEFGEIVGGAKIDLDSQLDDIERRELLAALARCNGNKAEVARSLGVQRTTLYYRLKRLGIDS
jgi:DNA-binding NtrC family response regulator